MCFDEQTKAGMTIYDYSSMPGPGYNDTTITETDQQRVLASGNLPGQSLPVFALSPAKPGHACRRQRGGTQTGLTVESYHLFSASHAAMSGTAGTLGWLVAGGWLLHPLLVRAIL